MVRKKIKWEKWVDPFEVFKQEHKEEAEELEEQHSNIGPTLVGPFGIVPVNESNQPSKVFNFWMGHTNFSITPHIKNVIDNVPGVEIFNIYTRYRFRIGIGLVFDEDKVMTTIEKRVTRKRKPKIIKTIKQSPTKLELIKQYLSNKYKYWAIIMFPDGQIDYKTGDSQDSVINKVKEYKEPVLKSWEQDNENK